MKNLKINKSTIARLAALIVALINQILVIFGQEVLPFTGNTVYQIVSLVITIIIVLINAWYNNDITKFALLSGKVFDALEDGKITEDEIGKLLDEYKDETVQTREKK